MRGVRNEDRTDLRPVWSLRAGGRCRVTPTPNWLTKLKKAAKANGLALTEAVSVAEIRHDNRCARLQGTGVCDCEPDVRLASRKIRRHEEETR